MQRLHAVFVLSLVLACASSQAKPAAPAAPAPESGAAVAADVRGSGEGASDVERIYELKFPEVGPQIGPKEAKVTLDVCSDFQCPFWARLVPTLHELAENYEELVRIRWRNCPLPMHEDAMPAAEAAMEVYKQGGDKAFWAYHDALFAPEKNDLARHIAGADRMSFTFTPFNAQSAVATFTVGGFSEQVTPALQRACGWTPSAKR